MSKIAADNKYTDAQIWIRGFVYLAISQCTELSRILADGVVDPQRASIALLLSGLITLRAYLDKTPSHGDGRSTPDESDNESDIEKTANAVAMRINAAKERS